MESDQHSAMAALLKRTGTSSNLVTAGQFQAALALHDLKRGEVIEHTPMMRGDNVRVCFVFEVCCRWSNDDADYP